MEGAGPGDTGNGSGTGEPGVVYTMENKPIVTCAGDQTLFTAVYSTLTQQLPREPMEWRRAYGRAPKMIHLESNFVQFKEELLPREGNKALLTFPFLHIYWTECCDTEVYKATTKDDITKWQNALRAHSSTDWLIVVVESEAKKKNKTNILPRTSIADKIRSDFCNKQSDRCMVLIDPLKDTARSQESWFLFLAKLRTLLLTSFTRNLGRFEDDMRTLREKRTEPGWSFCDYFMVQEELAFVFEMLQQFEDALVQYDELDALFSQYVLNFGAGDGANWLSSFCQPVRGWDGLALRKPIDMEKRDLIQKRRANLLELRSYLFSRQCTLLLFLQRPWEVAGRALELLHNCVQELRLLEVSVPPGALDCWVFLSCLEVLQRIEGCCDRAQMEANVAHTVGLWSYATEKLRSLGSLCGLVSESGPGSEELQRTVDLLAGLGAERPETANAAQSPYKTLQEALSSEEAFEKHYLDLSHATIEMYNSIGRTRSARLVGKDLADFYMRKSSPQKAEPFLQGALQMYQSEAWSLPLTHTRKQLADCQRRLAQTQPYLQTCCLLAADGNLSHEERRVYCQEILAFAKQSPTSAGAPLCLPLGSFAQLVSLRFEPATAVVHVGGSLRMELTLLSRMPEPLQLNHLTGHFHYSLDKNSYRKTAQWLMRHKPAGGPVTFQTEGAPGARGQPPVLELSEMYEKSPSEGGLTSTGVICRNVHMLIRPQDAQASSTPSPLDRQSVVSVDDGAHALRCSDVTLKPGINKLTFHAQAKEPGTYSLRQLTASVGDINLLLPHIYPIVQYDVYSQEPQLTVEPLSDCLLAGVPQKLKFTVTSGHYSVKEGDALQLSNADSMHVLGGGSPMAAIYRNSHEEVHHGALRIQRSEKVTSICLPPAPPYHLMEFELDVVCLLPEGGRLLNGELPRGGREPQDSCKSNTCEQRVSVDCPWSIYSTIISLTFHLPLKAQHKLLSSGTRKYIQVCVENLCTFGFQLSDSHLTSTQDLQLLPLHTAGLQDIQSQQRMFFVWEVTWRQHMPAFLPIHFSVAFSPVPALQPCEHLQPFTYSFHLENFFTLYTVRAEISPPPDAPFCKTGALCSLEVCVTRLCDRLDAEETLTDCEGYSSSQLFYQVVDGGSNWAVCGRSSGVVLMPVRRGSCHTVRMEVMPLFAGYLPYPDVRLFRYLPHHSHSQQLDADSWIENDSVSVEDPSEGPRGRSQGSSSSSLSPGPVGSSKEQKGLPMPRLQPFHAGQVSNSSIGRQILVIPSSDEHVLEVNVT